MKRLALSLLAVAVVASSVEKTASASDRSHGRSSAVVRHVIGDLIFGDHSYDRGYGRDRGHSSYQSRGHYGRSGYSPSYSRQSYSRQSHNYPSYNYSNYGQRGSYYSGYSRGFGNSYGRCR